jgi:hypothetical protein
MRMTARDIGTHEEQFPTTGSVECWSAQATFLQTAAMASNISVLRNVTRSDIRHDPYPHIVIENCLAPEIYESLVQTYPSDEQIIRQGESAGGARIRQNSRQSLGAHRVLRAPGSVSPPWEQFVRYHVSTDFFHHFATLFGPELLTIYPALERRLGRPLAQWTTGVRHEENTGDIALDCQIDINTPVTRRSSVRRVHTDAPDELFAMLFYFRQENDTSTGGDLEICRWKNGRAHRFIGSEIDERDAECISTVPYRANTLVAFINSENALHAVSARSPSPVSRRLVNLMGRVHRSVPEGLFVKEQKKGLVPLALRMKHRYTRGY